jgi:hypothetical protein
VQTYGPMILRKEFNQFEPGVCPIFYVDHSANGKRHQQ